MKDDKILQLLFGEEVTTSKETLMGTVPENIDVANAIVACMKKYKCWIFISDELLTRLKNEHKDHYPYSCVTTGIIFEITKPDTTWTLYIDKGSAWHKIHLLLDNIAAFDEQPFHLARDPEFIIFLS